MGLNEVSETPNALISLKQSEYLVHDIVDNREGLINAVRELLL
jgi:hypothetical protein